MGLQESFNQFKRLGETYAAADLHVRQILILRAVGLTPVPAEPSLTESLAEAFDQSREGFLLHQRSERWQKNQIADLIKLAPQTNPISAFDEFLCQLGFEIDTPQLAVEAESYLTYLHFLATIDFLSHLRPMSYDQLPAVKHATLSENDSVMPSFWPYRHTDEAVFNALNLVASLAPQVLNATNSTHSFDIHRAGHFFSAASNLLNFDPVD